MKFLTLMSALLVAGTVSAQDFSGIELPPVPQKQIAAQGEVSAEQAEDMSHRSSLPGKSRTELRKGNDADLLPLDIEILPGVNEIISISRGYLNRIVTPFDEPVVRTANNVQSHIEGNVIYVGTSDKAPVGLFILDKHGSPAISLSLIPKSIPQREIRLRFKDTTTATAYSPGRARKFEEADSYKRSMKSVLVRVAKGELPNGYKLSNPKPNDKVEFYCNLGELDIDLAQVLEGHHWRIGVSRVRNNTMLDAEIRESDCQGHDVLAVSAYPNAVVRAGEEAELYIVRKRAEQRKPNKERPYVFTH